MNKQLFRKVGHLLQPEMSCTPGTGGEGAVLQILFSIRQIKNPQNPFNVQTAWLAAYLQCSYCSL